MSYQPSPQQQAVYDFAENDSRSLIITARAGCGKTSTLLGLVERLVASGGDQQEIFVCAYNKSIADEVAAKLSQRGIDPRRARAGTMHAAGFSAWRYVAKNVKVDERKCANIYEELVQPRPQAESLRLELIRPLVLKLVSFAKHGAVGARWRPEDRSKWIAIVEHFGLDQEGAGTGEYGLDAGAVDWDEVITLSQAVLKTSFERDHDVVDFDDMVLAPLVHRARFWPKDFVLVDEAQDLNPARHALALAMLRPRTGRLVAVGDPAQAIYGFTGASSDSMERIRKATGAADLPLSVTYRCATAIVREANQYVPDLAAAPGAPSGVVRSLGVDLLPAELKCHEARPAEVAVVCRNTAPLVDLATNLLRKGIACKIEGRDLGAGLVRLARRTKAKTIATMRDRLRAYVDKEVASLMSQEKGAAAGALTDQAEAVLVVAEGCESRGLSTVEDLCNELTRMFGDTAPGAAPRAITLTTIHRSKGREWDTVYILGANRYMPSRWARMDWEREQEKNLAYVAITRAKSELAYVEVPKEQKERF